MVTSSYRHQLSWVTDGPARVFVALKITPNTLTIVGFVGVVATCCHYIVSGQTMLFCALSLFWGYFDLLDGAVARLAGQSTRWGSYLDAMMDRYTEAAVALTVAYVTGYWVLIFLVFAGSVITSYAKARASMEVFVGNLEWPDLAERCERNVIFVVGLGVNAVVTRTFAGHDIFWWVLVGLVVAIHVTVLQRMVRAKHFIDTRNPLKP